MMRNIIKWFIGCHYKNIVVVVVGAILALITTFSFLGNKKTKQYQQIIKSQQETINKLTKQTAEVECKIELNIKNNKNGVVVLDANMVASKLGEKVKEALNQK